MRESEFMGFPCKTPILNNDKLNWFSYSMTELPSVFIFFLKTNLNYNKSTHNRIVLKRDLIKSEGKRKSVFLEFRAYILPNTLSSRQLVCEVFSRFRVISWVSRELMPCGGNIYTLTTSIHIWSLAWIRAFLAFILSNFTYPIHFIGI